MKANFDLEIWLTNRRPFNPEDWLEKPKQRKLRPRQTQTIKNETGIQHDIEVVVRRIEAHQLDLTMNYQDWLIVGFALADGLGETGRDYYHRLSRFHPSYNQADCDRQYSKCLQGRRSGVSIKTFFYLAQSAGINIKV
ncbi:PriCT-2 domain-containing protein [Sunxiuqinia dokdonensis]|uniref:Primase C-terminal 2 domain-containing protein n=1 Tax=Sunxiuqinia dokdonensis TaxID=1409788 RepID=A0A0L8VFA7_9BACT|nr:PriCT-2 domain-containing protein [Sunxiuqinia dokdonensis]KOH47063.1 hypothetical protein NC99_01060 [Sunxiuqinia dokdonensis]